MNTAAKTILWLGFFMILFQVFIYWPLIKQILFTSPVSGASQGFGTGGTLGGILGGAGYAITGGAISPIPIGAGLGALSHEPGAIPIPLWLLLRDPRQKALELLRQSRR